MSDLSCRYKNYPTNYPGRIPLVLQTLRGQSLGNFLCCCTVVTSLHLACNTALLGRGTATCHNPKTWRQGDREFKWKFYAVVKVEVNVCACMKPFVLADKATIWIISHGVMEDTDIMLIRHTSWQNTNNQVSHKQGYFHSSLLSFPKLHGGEGELIFKSDRKRLINLAVSK